MIDMLFSGASIATRLSTKNDIIFQRGMKFDCSKISLFEGI